MIFCSVILSVEGTDQLTSPGGGIRSKLYLIEKQRLCSTSCEDYIDWKTPQTAQEVDRFGSWSYMWGCRHISLSMQSIWWFNPYSFVMLRKGGLDWIKCNYGFTNVIYIHVYVYLERDFITAGDTEIDKEEGHWILLHGRAEQEAKPDG